MGLYDGKINTATTTLTTLAGDHNPFWSHDLLRPAHLDWFGFFSSFFYGFRREKTKALEFWMRVEFLRVF